VTAATYTVEELAELLRVSEWSLYSSVRGGTSPVPAIRVGRRIVFAKAAVDHLLGLVSDPREAP
jgi:excisionase family DNA binding protein